MSSKIFAATFLSVILLFTGRGQATLLTSDVGYAGPGLDLTAYVGLGYNFTFGPKPIPGGITFTSNVINSNSGLGSVLGQGGYGLAANGSFGLPAVYAGLDGPQGFMSFLFSSPVSEFGAYLNYAPGVGDPQKIGAYDSGNNLLEEWTLPVSAPISTPAGFNQFEFRGIRLASATISEFRLSGGYLLAAASPAGNPTPPNPNPTIPEPTSLFVMGGLSLMGLSLLRRDRKG